MQNLCEKTFSQTYIQCLLGNITKSMIVKPLISAKQVLNHETKATRLLYSKAANNFYEVNISNLPLLFGSGRANISDI